MVSARKFRVDLWSPVIRNGHMVSKGRSEKEGFYTTQGAVATAVCPRRSGYEYLELDKLVLGPKLKSTCHRSWP